MLNFTELEKKKKEKDGAHESSKPSRKGYGKIREAQVVSIKGLL